MKITAPLISQDHPDRHILCQDALHDAFREIVGRATAAGWSEREANSALIELGDNQMPSVAAVDKADALINLLKRMT